MTTTGTTTTGTTTTADVVSLHLLSLVPAAFGLCCLAADRRRARALEFVAAVIMMAAMADTAFGRLVPPVWWSAVLLATALILAVLRGRARSPRAMPLPGGGAQGPGSLTGSAAAAMMGVHTGSGLIVMATLLLAMVGNGAAVAGGHHHGSSIAGLPAVGVTLTFAYVIGSVVVAIRARSGLDRAQYVAMASSAAVMALAVVVPATS